NDFDQSGSSYNSAELIMDDKLVARSSNSEQSKQVTPNHESFSQISLGLLSQEEQDILFGAD
ncbi:24191_t:CDS:1, partial [Racocetra persica]